MSKGCSCRLFCHAGDRNFSFINNQLLFPFQLIINYGKKRLPPAFDRERQETLQPRSLSGGPSNILLFFGRAIKRKEIKCSSKRRMLGPRMLDHKLKSERLGAPFTGGSKRKRSRSPHRRRKEWAISVNDFLDPTASECNLGRAGTSFSIIFLYDHTFLFFIIV